MSITNIPVNDRRERFTASAGQTVFPYDFPVYALTDLRVTRLRGTAETVLVNGSDYAVSGAGQQAGGNVTLTAGAQAGDVIVIESAMPVQRQAQFSNGGALPAAGLEAEFNRVLIALQQFANLLSLTLRVPATDPSVPSLPPVSARANRLLGCDAAGNLIPAEGTIGNAVITPFAITLLDDADAVTARATMGAMAASGGTFSGVFRTITGTAAAPAFTPTGDINTGMFFPAQDQIGIAIGGVEALRMDDGRRVGLNGLPASDIVLLVRPAVAGGIQRVLMQNAATTAGTQARYDLATGTPNAFSISTITEDGSGNAAYELSTGAGINNGFVLSSGNASTPISFRIGATTRAQVTPTGLSVNGDLSFNSGYGSAAPAFGCRAWVNFNGTGTPSIRASGNVSSITDNGPGDHTVNLAAAMPDANYTVVAMGTWDGGPCFTGHRTTSPQTTTGFRVISGLSGGAPQDSSVTTAAVFR